MAADQKAWNQFADAIDSPDDVAFHVIASHIRAMARPEWYPMDADEEDFIQRYGAVLAVARQQRKLEHALRVAELEAMPIKCPWDERGWHPDDEGRG